MATADQYAQWIVDNADKKGTEEFNTVAQAYQEARTSETATKPVAPAGKSRYEDSGMSTFLANAVNSATFGLPEYLNKKFTPDQYAEGEQYRAANPMAANTGDIAGNLAGYAIPVGAGAKLGAQGALKTSELLSKFGPDLAKRYGSVVGNFGKFGRDAVVGTTGAAIGAQTGAALPGIVQGDPAAAAGAPLAISQVHPIAEYVPGMSKDIIPAMAAGAAEKVRSFTEQFRMQQLKQEKMAQARAVLAQPPTAQNFIERMEATATLYGKN